MASVYQSNTKEYRNLYKQIEGKLKNEGIQKSTIAKYQNGNLILDDILRSSDAKTPAIPKQPPKSPIAIPSIPKPEKVNSLKLDELPIKELFKKEGETQNINEGNQEEEQKVIQAQEMLLNNKLSSTIQTKNEDMQNIFHPSKQDVPIKAIAHPTTALFSNEQRDTEKETTNIQQAQNYNIDQAKQILSENPQSELTQSKICPMNSLETIKSMEKVEKLNNEAIYKSIVNPVASCLLKNNAIKKDFIQTKSTVEGIVQLTKAAHNISIVSTQQMQNNSIAHITQASCLMSIIESLRNENKEINEKYLAQQIECKRQKEQTSQYLEEIETLQKQIRDLQSEYESINEIKLKTEKLSKELLEKNNYLQIYVAENSSYKQGNKILSEQVESLSNVIEQQTKDINEKSQLITKLEEKLQLKERESLAQSKSSDEYRLSSINMEAEHTSDATFFDNASSQQNVLYYQGNQKRIKDPFSHRK